MNPFALRSQAIRGTLIFLALLTAFVGSSGGSAEEQLRIEPLDRVDASRFPEITLRFRVVDAQRNPVRHLPPGQFVIYEDGQEVHRFDPQRTTAQPLAVVLTMDTSGSMESGGNPFGRPSKMQAARQAGERFFDRLDPSARSGLVLFHHAPYHRENLTRDRQHLKTLVRQTQAGGGTAYLDAASVSIRMLAEQAADSRRVVVLMTDGRDVNSKLGLDEVIEEARRHETTVYTIGLGEPGRNEWVRTVLVLDRSGSMAGSKIAALHQAARRFVALMSAHHSDTTVLPFHTWPETPGPFTNDRNALYRQIDSLQAFGNTALYDAIYEGLETLNAGRFAEKGPIRRAVVVFTDGADTSSRRNPLEVVARAKAVEVPVYLMGLGSDDEISEPVMKWIAEQTGGEYYRVRSPDDLTPVFEQLSIRLHDDGIDEASLRRLAEETGGAYYHVRDADQLALNFEQVAGELASVYSVTFRSHRARPDGTSRGIEIRLGELVSGHTGYATHGLITPSMNALVYLGLLTVLLVLLAMPGWGRRLLRAGSGISSSENSP